MLTEQKKKQNTKKQTQIKSQIYINFKRPFERWHAILVINGSRLVIRLDFA